MPLIVGVTAPAGAQALVNNTHTYSKVRYGTVPTEWSELVLLSLTYIIYSTVGHTRTGTYCTVMSERVP